MTPRIWQNYYPSKNCGMCGQPLPQLSLKDVIATELEFRENYPDEWDIPGRMLICDPCNNRILETRDEEDGSGKTA